MKYGFVPMSFGEPRGEQESRKLLRDSLILEIAWKPAQEEWACRSRAQQGQTGWGMGLGARAPRGGKGEEAGEMRGRSLCWLILRQLV